MADASTRKKLVFAVCFFGKLKQFRRIATRYKKLAANYLAMLKLASIRLWLRTYATDE